MQHESVVTYPEMTSTDDEFIDLPTPMELGRRERKGRPPTKRVPGRKPGRPKGSKGSSNRTIDYSCTVCGNVTPRDNLVVKKVVFSRVGKGGKQLRARTRAWICDTCIESDPDWSAPAYFSSPGLRDTRAD